MKNIPWIFWAGVLLAPLAVRAGDSMGSTSTITTPTVAKAPGNTRYGMFDWLDRRSEYGQGSFPEPFLVDDSDGEINEARLDWLHTSGEHSHTDRIKAEVEKGFGPLTLEIEAPVQRDDAYGQVDHGFDNVDLGARCPFYEYVSSDKFIDCTFGTAIEVGIPVTSAISENAEVVPKVFNDLKVGDHFTLQSLLGYSTLLGSGSEGGLQTLEYGFVFGWTIPHEQLAIPFVQQFIPVFEFDGGWQMSNNDGDRLHDELLGNIGFRANLDAIGPIQPRLGAGFVFPIDNGASQDTHWGVATSLVFEY